MKPRWLPLLAAVPLTMLAAPDPLPAPTGQPNNGFALALLAQLSRTERGNLFFSPYSIRTAFALATLGAAGETRAEIAAAFHFPDSKKLPEDQADLRAAVEKGAHESGATLQIANGLWVDQTCTVRPEYLADARKLNAEITAAQFTTAPEKERVRINAWVERQTHDRIKDLFPAGSIDPLSRLVIANAIYFKGQWEHGFEKKATAPEIFHAASGTEAKVPMMRLKASVRYAEADGTQWLELPYQKFGLAMVLALPAPGAKLDAVIAKWTAPKLEEILSALGERQVLVKIPSFKLDYDLDLKPPLQALGIKQAFDAGTADFSGITGTRDLSIAAAVHKAFVEVNEEGTEAAAATGIVMALSAAMPGAPVSFTADRPFVFFIRDTATGALLFAGRVAELK